MKTNDVQPVISRSTIENELVNRIKLHKRMKNCLFWQGPFYSNNIDYYNRTYSRDNFVFLYNGDTIETEQETTCSRNNVYYKLTVSQNGYKKDVRLLKKILKQIQT